MHVVASRTGRACKRQSREEDGETGMDRETRARGRGSGCGVTKRETERQRGSAGGRRTGEGNERTKSCMEELRAGKRDRGGQKRGLGAASEEVWWGQRIGEDQAVGAGGRAAGGGGGCGGGG